MFVGGGPHAIADPRMGPGTVRHNNVYRVVRWSDFSPAVTAGHGPTGGGAAVADPRVGYGHGTHNNKLKVAEWDKPTLTVTAANQVQGGALSVADPRPGSTVFSGHGVTKWEEPAGAVAGESFPTNGKYAVADPRPEWKRHGNNLAVVDWAEHAPLVIAGGKGVQGGYLSVADPRPACVKGDGDHYKTGGHYGVVPWHRPANVVAGTASHDNGFNNVADPRIPAGEERLVALIVAADGTWHRPFTTFELAGLQSLVEPEEWLQLDGLSDSAWRERIGNAIPKKAAKAIADVCGRTLLLAWTGETFFQSDVPIWVRDVAVALAVKPA
jgi:site-specific DNA-cytosine methylase